MKKFLAVISIVLLIGVFAGCDENPEGQLATPVVTTSTSDDYSALNLSWGAVANAEEYIVSYNNTVDTVTATSYTVTEPAMKVSVVAIGSGYDNSTAWEKNYEAVVTTLDVYSTADPSTDHPSGFGFNAHGEATAYSVSDQSNHASIDYIVYDNSGTLMFVSISDYPNSTNSEKNSLSQNLTTPFDDLDLASPEGSYSTQRDLVQNGMYSLWLAEGDDRFGKLQVQGVSGTKVTIRVALQEEPKLRWVKTQE